jgi:hypothetical protein
LRRTVSKLTRLLLLLVALSLGSSGLFAECASADVSHPSARSGLRTESHLSSLAFSRINAIRVSFGLTRGRVTTAFDAHVVEGLNTNDDPSFAFNVPGVVDEYSEWGVVPFSSAATSASPIEIVNAWVYNDGWNGSQRNTLNVDCSSAKAQGCGGHRAAVLSTPPRPGAQLYIDTITRTVDYQGTPMLAVAALLVWKMPSTA